MALPFALLFHPSVSVDIGATLETKTRAMALYGSEARSLSPLAWGATGHCAVVGE